MKTFCQILIVMGVFLSCAFVGFLGSLAMVDNECDINGVPDVTHPGLVVPLEDARPDHIPQLRDLGVAALLPGHPGAESSVRLSVKIGKRFSIVNAVVVDGGALTCWHCVDRINKAWVIDDNGDAYEAVSWTQIGDIDAAFLTFKGKLPIKPARLSTKKARFVHAVEATGFWGQGFELGRRYYTVGYCRPMAPHDRHMSGLMFAAMGGMSGSPVFRNGELMGLITSVPINGWGEGLVYATPVDRETLQAMGYDEARKPKESPK